MKKIEAQSVGEIIHEVFRYSGMEGTEARQRVLLQWSEIVGQGINRQTTKRFVDASGVMHVFISSAALKSDLQFMRSHLIRQLNEAVGTMAITDLIIH